MMLLREHEIWDYSAQNVEYLKSRGLKATHVPVSYHPAALHDRALVNFELTRHKERKFDILYLGSFSERRRKILQGLIDKGLQVVIAYDIWGEERDRMLLDAKIVLNIHPFDDGHIFESVRISQVLAYGCFVISETCMDVPHWAQDHKKTDGVVFVDYDYLVPTVLQVLGSTTQKKREQASRTIFKRFIRSTSYCGETLKQFAVDRPLRVRHGGSWLATYLVFDDDRWLSKSIESIYPSVDGFIFLVGYLSFQGEYVPNRRFIDVLKSIPDPDNKFLGIYRKSWLMEEHARNDTLNFAQALGYSYTITIDADEIYNRKDIEGIKKELEDHPDLNAVHVGEVRCYWKSEEYRIEPPEPYTFFHVAARVNSSIRFMKNRETTDEFKHMARDTVLHHMSYARTDDELMKKITRWPHKQEVLAGWYESVWKGWDRNRHMENIHPTHPTQYRRAVPVSKSELPLVLQSSFKIVQGGIPGVDHVDKGVEEMAAEPSRPRGHSEPAGGIGKRVQEIRLGDYQTRESGLITGDSSHYSTMGSYLTI